MTRRPLGLSWPSGRRVNISWGCVCKRAKHVWSSMGLVPKHWYFTFPACAYAWGREGGHTSCNLAWIFSRDLKLNISHNINVVDFRNAWFHNLSQVPIVRGRPASSVRTAKFSRAVHVNRTDYINKHSLLMQTSRKRWNNVGHFLGGPHHHQPITVHCWT